MRTTQLATSILATVVALSMAAVAGADETPELKQVASALRPVLESVTNENNKKLQPADGDVGKPASPPVDVKVLQWTDDKAPGGFMTGLQLVSLPPEQCRDIVAKAKPTQPPVVKPDFKTPLAAADYFGCHQNMVDPPKYMAVHTNANGSKFYLFSGGRHWGRRPLFSEVAVLFEDGEIRFLNTEANKASEAIEVRLSIRNDKSDETEQIAVTKTYGGIIDISASLTDEPPPLNGEKFEPLLVIRTQQEYADLLRRIPTEGISQGAPAPKNNDPILQKPQIDFTNKMLVVVLRASMDAPEIRKVIRKDGVIVIEAELSDLSLPRPYGTGTYNAVLIPLSRDKVIVQTKERKKKDDEPQPSAGGDVKPAPPASSLPAPEQLSTDTFLGLRDNESRKVGDYKSPATPAGVVSNFIREVSALATKHTELADFPEYVKRQEAQSQVEFKKDIKPFAVSFDKNTTPVLTKRRIRTSDCGTNGIFLQFVLDDGTNERQAPSDTVTYYPNLKLTLYAEVVLWEKASPELKKKLEDMVAEHKAMLSELDKAKANKPDVGDGK